MNEATVKSYTNKHTLWQAIAESSEITLHSSATDKQIVVALNCCGKRLATERLKFRSYKARDAAMERAKKKGNFEVVAGECTSVR